MSRDTGRSWTMTERSGSPGVYHVTVSGEPEVVDKGGEANAKRISDQQAQKEGLQAPIEGYAADA